VCGGSIAIHIAGISLNDLARRTSHIIYWYTPLPFETNYITDRGLSRYISEKM